MSHPEAAHGRARRAARGPARSRHTRHTAARPKRWSAHVTQTSDALDVEPDLFKSADADAIAASLKRSAERSTRRRTSPFQSAMSMLNFYLNRAGRNLPKSRRATLERAKRKLREAFGRKP